MKCILAVTSAKVCDFVTIYFKVGGVQELSEGRHVIAEKVERADELVGLGCSELLSMMRINELVGLGLG